MQVSCHGNNRAGRTFKKFDFLEMPTAAPMSNFVADFNIASVSLIGLGKMSSLLSNMRNWKEPP